MAPVFLPDPENRVAVKRSRPPSPPQFPQPERPAPTNRQPTAASPPQSDHRQPTAVLKNPSTRPPTNSRAEQPASSNCSALPAPLQLPPPISAAQEEKRRAARDSFEASQHEQSNAVWAGEGGPTGDAIQLAPQAAFQPKPQSPTAESATDSRAAQPASSNRLQALRDPSEAVPQRHDDHEGAQFSEDAATGDLAQLAPQAAPQDKTPPPALYATTSCDDAQEYPPEHEHSKSPPGLTLTETSNPWLQYQGNRSILAATQFAEVLPIPTDETPLFSAMLKVLENMEESNLWHSLRDKFFWGRANERATGLIAYTGKPLHYELAEKVELMLQTAAAVRRIVSWGDTELNEAQFLKAWRSWRNNHTSWMHEESQAYLNNSVHPTRRRAYVRSRFFNMLHESFGDKRLAVVLVKFPMTAEHHIKELVQCERARLPPEDWRESDERRFLR